MLLVLNFICLSCIKFYMLGMRETIDQLATPNGVRWYGHVLRRDDDSILRVAVARESNDDQRRPGRSK